MKPTDLYQFWYSRVLLVAMLAFFFVQPVTYAQNDAFSIEVAVSQRSTDEQQDAYMAGLRRILLNNSGDKTILNRDAVRQAIRQAEDYVQTFSYRRPPPGTVLASDTPITSRVQQSGQATQLMLVSFDRDLVTALINDSASLSSADPAEDAPAPVSGGNSALVWLLIRDEGRDILISDAAAANVRKRAQEIAGAAGISLVYPAGDAEDLQLLPVENIVAQTLGAENISAASIRYAQPRVLIGYLARDNVLGWVGQWTDINGDQVQRAEFDSANLDQGLQQGLAMLNSATQIDETYRYGGTATSDTEGLIWVDSLNSTESYARMIRFFESVGTVSTVYPKEVQASSMVFAVVPRSALLDIESSVGNTTWLQQTTAPIDYSADTLARSVDLAIRYER